MIVPPGESAILPQERCLGRRIAKRATATLADPTRGDPTHGVVAGRYTPGTMRMK
jgi:hypothetical protein